MSSSPASFLSQQSQASVQQAINYQALQTGRKQLPSSASSDTPTLLNSLLQKPPATIAAALASTTSGLPPTPPLGAGAVGLPLGIPSVAASSLPPGIEYVCGTPSTVVDHQRWAAAAYQHGRYIQGAGPAEMAKLASEINPVKPLLGTVPPGLMPAHFANLPIRPFPSSVSNSAAAAAYMAGYSAHVANFVGSINMPVIPSPTAGTPPAIRFGYPMDISSNGGDVKHKPPSASGQLVTKQHPAVAALRHETYGSTAAPFSAAASTAGAGDSPVANELSSTTTAGPTTTTQQQMRHSPVSPVIIPAYPIAYHHPAGSPFAVHNHLQTQAGLGGGGGGGVVGPASPFGAQPPTPTSSSSHRQRSATSAAPPAATVSHRAGHHHQSKEYKDYCRSVSAMAAMATPAAATPASSSLTNGVFAGGQSQMSAAGHVVDEKSFVERLNGRSTPSVASSESRFTSTPIDSKPPRLIGGTKDSHPSTPAMNSPGETSSAMDDMESSLSSSSWTQTPMSPATSTRHSNSQTSFIGRPSNGSAATSTFGGVPSSSASSFQVAAGIMPSGQLTPNQASLIDRLVGDFRLQSNMGYQEWEDRRRFFEHFVQFFDQNPSSTTQLSDHPSVSKQPVDLYVLYKFVKQHGGYMVCTKQKTWRHMCKLFNVNESNSASGQIKKQYAKYLLPYECYYELNRADPGPIIKACESKKKTRAKLQQQAAAAAAAQNLPAGYPSPQPGNMPGPRHFGVLPPGTPLHQHQQQHQQYPPNFQQPQMLSASFLPPPPHHQHQQSPHQHMQSPHQHPQSTLQNAPSAKFGEASTPATVVVALPTPGRGRPPKPGSKRAAARQAAALAAAAAAAAGSGIKSANDVLPASAADGGAAPAPPQSVVIETAVNPFDDSQMTPSSRLQTASVDLQREQ